MEFQGAYFPRHVFHSGTKNGNLAESFFELTILMSFEDPQKLQFYEKYLQQKGYDTLQTTVHFIKNVSLWTSNNSNKDNVI